METVNHEYYVSPEVAKLLKEAGFDWEYNRYYEFDGKLVWAYFENWNDAMWSRHSTAIYSAPTLDVTQRWLREAKNISVDISSTCYSEYEYIIRKVNQSHYRDNTILALTACKFYTYEEAQESGIKNALEILLEKGE